MSQVSRETFGVKSQMRGGGRWRGGGGAEKERIERKDMLRKPLISRLPRGGGQGAMVTRPLPSH